MSTSLITRNAVANRQWTSALKVQIHFGADVDYFVKLSHYSFGAGVAKLSEGIKVRELFENAIFNETNLALVTSPVQQMQEFLEILIDFYCRTSLLRTARLTSIWRSVFAFPSFSLRLVFTSDEVGVGVSRKRPYDLVKIENRSLKRSHRLFTIYSKKKKRLDDSCGKWDAYPEWKFPRGCVRWISKTFSWKIGSKTIQAKRSGTS